MIFPFRQLLLGPPARLMPSAVDAAPQMASSLRIGIIDLY
jgi:hypothetical protein